MPVHMQIRLSDEVSDKLAIIAERNHRSKRSEVLAALDHYIRVNDNTDRSTKDEHDLPAPSA